MGITEDLRFLQLLLKPRRRGFQQLLPLQSRLVFGILPQVPLVHGHADLGGVVGYLHLYDLPQLLLLVLVALAGRHQAHADRLLLLVSEKLVGGKALLDLLLQADAYRRIELLYILYEGIQPCDRFLPRFQYVVQQIFLFEQEILDLLVDFSVEAHIALAVDLPKRDVQKVDQSDEQLFPVDLHPGNPGFVEEVSDQPDERLSVLSVVVEDLAGQLRQRLPLLVPHQLVDDELALIAQEQSSIDGGPVRVVLAQLDEEALLQLRIIDLREQIFEIIHLLYQVGEGKVHAGVEMRIHGGQLLDQHVAGYDQFIDRRGGFQEAGEVGKHFGEVVRVRFGVLQKVPQRLDAVEIRFLGFEFVEGLLLEGDRLVPDRVAVQFLRNIAEYRIGLEDLPGLRAPLGPLTGAQHRRDQLLLDQLHVRRVVKTADYGLEGPDRITFHLLFQLLFGPGVDQDPDVIVAQHFQRAHSHLQAHLVSGFRGEIHYDHVVLDVLDLADLPAGVVHVVAHVEGDVLFEVSDRVVDVAPALIEVRNAQILVELAVITVFLAEAFHDLLTGFRVFRLVGEDPLQQLYGGVPILLLLVVGDEIGQQLGCPIPAQDLDDLALYGEEKLHVFRGVLDDLLPYFPYVRKHLLVDEAVQRLLPELDSALERSLLLFLVRQQLDDLRLLVVDLDVALPDLVLLLLLVLVLIHVGQGLQGEFVLPVLQDPVAEVLHDVPFVVVHEDIDQNDDVRVIHQLLAQGNDPRDVQTHDAVAGVLEVLLADCENLILRILLLGRRHDFIELGKITDRVAVQSSPGPFFLVQQLRYLFHQLLRQVTAPYARIRAKFSVEISVVLN